MDAPSFSDAAVTAAEAATGVFTHTFGAFDTGIQITIRTRDRARAQHAFHCIQQQCEMYEHLLSKTIPTSDVSRLNNAHGQTTRIADTTARVIAAALHYCRNSRGRFDITVGQVSACWNFKQRIVADAQQLAQAVTHVDWRNVRVFKCDGASYAQLADAKAAIDLGGIAKGWIADELTGLLEAQGLCDFVLNLGGNVVVRGRNAHGNPWPMSIVNPKNPSRAIALLRIPDVSVVTSGTYFRSFTRNGTSYHHILDPQTGMPARTDAESATIICKRSLDAEGYSTTVLSLGVQDGLDFCRSLPEVLNAFVVGTDGAIAALY